MSEPTDDQVRAAMAASHAYSSEIARQQRAKSLELFGHGGAHISTIQHDPAEAMRRALAAADNQDTPA